MNKIITGAGKAGIEALKKAISALESLKAERVSVVTVLRRKGGR